MKDLGVLEGLNLFSITAEEKFSVIRIGFDVLLRTDSSVFISPLYTSGQTHDVREGNPGPTGALAPEPCAGSGRAQVDLSDQSESPKALASAIAQGKLVG